MATARLGRRALVSWKRSLALALLVSAAVVVWRSRMPTSYEVTVVVRVSDGGLQAFGAGADLGLGTLRAYLKDRAFTSSRLLELMGRHPDIFPSLASDPVMALAGLREDMAAEITDNDFVEERSSGDPPRSARIALSFRSSSPDRAWTVAHELADTLIGSTRARERSMLERDERAAAETLRQAQADFQEFSRTAKPAGPNPDPTLMSIRDRVRSAEKTHAAAQIALRSSVEQQALRLELVDPGRLPDKIDPSVALTSVFFIAFFITLATAWLLAGAFDPRVLDGDDLTALGVAFLGQTSALPTRLVSRDGRTRGGRAPRV